MTFETLQKADAEKTLHVTIPVDEAHRQYRLVIIVEPVAFDAGTRTSPCKSWPPGFFENTVGKWVGEFERPSQGEFEKREDL